MKTTITYIHGYGSSPESETAQTIKNAFPDENFLCPHINHSDDPAVTYEQMLTLAKRMVDEDSILIGSSAGGFWADYFGSLYGIKTVLINPSLLPSVNFRKYNLPKPYYEKYEILESLIKHVPRHNAVTFVGENDDIVPISHVNIHYKNPIVLKGEGHRLKDLSPIIDMIKSMIGNFPEHNDEIF